MKALTILTLEILLLTATHADASPFRLDDLGQLVVESASGEHLTAPRPILRWEGRAPEIVSRQGEEIVLTFPGGAPVCAVRSLERGQHGEICYGITLSNPGTDPIEGQLAPGLADWLEEAAGADPDSLALIPPMAYAGGIGGMLAWSTHEFSRDVFVTVPARPALADGADGAGGAEGSGTAQSLTASLLRMDSGRRRPLVMLAPGAEAAFVLHLDVIDGGRAAVLREIYRVRGGYRVEPDEYDFSEYQRPQLAWANDLLAGWLNWAWDKDNMDPRTGEYRILESLDDAKRRFGGYELYMWWPFWPRAGFDGRYQFDHYRDMPGGVDGLRAIVRQCRERGVRTIVSHCIWSETDRDRSREGHLDSYRQLVEMALALEGDGVLMDIMDTTPPEIIEMVRAHGKELLPYAEGDPGYADSQTNLIGRIHNMHRMPEFNLKKYLLPHHPILRVCEPGNVGKRLRKDFVLSFFNGHGIEINTMFPEAHPDCDADWPVFARALDILRTHRAAFRSTEWEPLVPGEDAAVRINRWPSGGITLYTLCGTNPGGHHGPTLRLPHAEVRYLDLWNQRPARVERDGNTDVVSVDIEAFAPGLAQGTADYSAGCLAVIEPVLEARLDFEMLTLDLAAPIADGTIEIWVDRIRPDAEPLIRPAAAQTVDLYQALGRQTSQALVIRLLDSRRQTRDMVVLPPEPIRFWRFDKPVRTEPVDARKPPAGMVRIPGGDFEYAVAPTAPTWQATYVSAKTYAVADPMPPRTLTLPAFWMDRYPVTNAEYARFLEDSDYRPASAQNFLAHWTEGRIPAGQENHPVVYVDYDDARAFAEWAGKRLPSEEEWQFAAGAADGRTWPWGAEPVEGRCNNSAAGTTAVDAHPGGGESVGRGGSRWQRLAVDGGTDG